MENQKILDNDIIRQDEIHLSKLLKWSRLFLVIMLLFGQWLFRDSFNELYYFYIDSPEIIGLEVAYSSTSPLPIDILIVRIVSGLLMVFSSIVGFLDRNRGISLMWVLGVLYFIFWSLASLWEYAINDFYQEYLYSIDLILSIFFFFVPYCL